MQHNFTGKREKILHDRLFCALHIHDGVNTSLVNILRELFFLKHVSGHVFRALRFLVVVRRLFQRVVFELQNILVQRQSPLSAGHHFVQSNNMHIE